MTRRRLTRGQKTRIFDAAHGLCHICNSKIFVECGERWEVEHVKPLHLGGADDFSNLKPAHVHCHRGKTVREHVTRLKDTRVRAKHLGIAKYASRPLPGTYRSGIKLSLSGPPRWRDSGRIVGSRR